MSTCDVMTPRVQRWLACSEEARILHLFADVCNLVNERGQVVSLVSRRIGAGPFALVIGERSAWPANKEERVRIDREAERVYAGPLVIDYGRAGYWQPKPAWHRLRRWVAPVNPQARYEEPRSGDDFGAVRGQVNEHSVSGGRYVEGTRFLENAITLQVADSASKVDLLPETARLLGELIDGVCQEDPRVVREGATRLAGRGWGLTPTGDDLLVGVLYALWVWRPGSTWPALIADSAIPRTTTLSAAFLQAAAAGEATEPWHRLVAGDGQAVAEIRATGHRSGAETWAGFMVAGTRFRDESG